MAEEFTRTQKSDGGDGYYWDGTVSPAIDDTTKINIPTENKYLDGDIFISIPSTVSITGTAELITNVEATALPKVTPKVSLINSEDYGYTTTPPTTDKITISSGIDEVITPGIVDYSIEVDKGGYMYEDTEGNKWLSSSININSVDVNTDSVGYTYYQPIVDIEGEGGTLDLQANSSFVNLRTDSNIDTSGMHAIAYGSGKRGAVTYSNISGAIAAHSSQNLLEAQQEYTSATKTTYVTGANMSNGKKFNVHDTVYDWTFEVDSKGNITIG